MPQITHHDTVPFMLAPLPAPGRWTEVGARALVGQRVRLPRADSTETFGEVVDVLLFDDGALTLHVRPLEQADAA